MYYNFGGACFLHLHGILVHRAGRTGDETSRFLRDVASGRRVLEDGSRARYQWDVQHCSQPFRSLLTSGHRVTCHVTDQAFVILSNNRNNNNVNNSYIEWRT
jgi:hypothetical protein